MQSGLLFVLSWLGFSVFFYAIYLLLLQSEWIFGSILIILSALAIYFSMKLSDKERNEETKKEKTEDFVEIEINSKNNDFIVGELIEEKQKESLTEEFMEEETKNEEQFEFPKDEIQVKESPWEISISNEKINFILNPLIEEMMREKMFMENDDFILSKEKIIDKYLVQEKIHRYQFHPIPLVAIIYNQEIKQFQIVMGLTRDKMDYVAALPEQYKDAMQRIYKDLYNVKAYIEQGPYRIVDENLEEAIHPEANFHLRLRFYFQ